MTEVKVMPVVDRAAASRKAVEMRGKRSRLKSELRLIGGHVDLLEATASYDTADEEALSLRVTDFLMTLPSVGDKKLVRLLEEAKVSPRKRLGGLGSIQRAALMRVIIREEDARDARLAGAKAKEAKAGESEAE